MRKVCVTLKTVRHFKMKWEANRLDCPVFRQSFYTNLNHQSYGWNGTLKIKEWNFIQGLPSLPALLSLNDFPLKNKKKALLDTTKQASVSVDKMFSSFVVIFRWNAAKISGNLNKSAVAVDKLAKRIIYREVMINRSWFSDGTGLLG